MKYYATLQQSVEAYRKAYGHYQARVPADTIFRTRENLKCCKDHRIYLNGSKLGKPFADPTEAEKHKKLRLLVRSFSAGAEWRFRTGWKTLISLLPEKMALVQVTPNRICKFKKSLL